MLIPMKYLLKMFHTFYRYFNLIIQLKVIQWVTKDDLIFPN